MNDVQNKMYELLQKFDRQSRELGITYYLGGGTALGAIRHGGFLPWDDDADIYITRDNYEKMLAVQDEFFSEDFVLVNYEKYPRYGNTLVRCVDTKSAAITKARIADEAPKGQLIELFILDPMPRDADMQDEWKTKHWIYAELMSYAFRVANERIAPWVDRALYDEYKEKCATLGRKQVLAQLEDELFTIPESEADEYCSRWGFRNLIYDISWFEEPRYVSFEDTKLPVATCAEKVLRFDYGDGWKYIPEGTKRVTHSFAENVRISYKDFEEDYKQFIDLDQIFDSYEDRKEKLMDYYFVNDEAKKTRRELKETQVITSLQYNLESYSKLAQWVANGDWESLEDFFKIWHDNQFDTSFWRAQKCIDIENDMLYYALLLILMRGDYYNARTLLLWRKKEKSLSPDLQNILDYVEGIRAVYIAVDDEKDYTKAKKLIQEEAILSFAYHEKQFDYEKLSIEIAVHMAQNEQELSQAEKNCRNLLKEYPDNGEILSLYGDIEDKSGKTEEATSYYENAYKRTQDGLVRRHIEDMIGTSIRTEIENK